MGFINTLIEYLLEIEKRKEEELRQELIKQLIDLDKKDS